ncbi:MAG: ATP-binding cassette domain-containing protein [Methylohalobius crimeensis]
MSIEIEIRRKVFPGQGRARPHTAIENLYLTLRENEFVCLVGPSGCGKTTLLNLIAGLDKDFEGQIDFHLSQPPRLGYVFQEPRLLPWRTVRQNLELVLPAEHGPEIITELLETTGLARFQHTYPSRLSLGMGRRVALARAFAVEPDVLLMDEPFVSLDAAIAEKMRQLLHKLWQRRPHTILFVTHDLREAIALADRLVFLTPPPTRSDWEFVLPRARQVRDEHTIETLHRELRNRMQFPHAPE